MTAHLHVPRALNPAIRRRPVILRKGELLRLDRAQGTTVRAASGRLWITEERRLADVVLLPGYEHRLDSRGRALVAAEHCSRLVIEWPAKRAAPHAEVACAEGEPGRAIALGPLHFTGLVAALSAWWMRLADERRESPWTPDAVRDRLAHLVPLLRF